MLGTPSETFWLHCLQFPSLVGALVSLLAGSKIGCLLLGRLSPAQSKEKKGGLGTLTWMRNVWLEFLECLEFFECFECSDLSRRRSKIAVFDATFNCEGTAMVYCYEWYILMVIIHYYILSMVLWSYCFNLLPHQPIHKHLFLPMELPDCLPSFFTHNNIG